MRKLWISFGIVFTLSFAVLGWIGTRIFQQMPPIPARVVTTEGETLVADGDIARGQNVWQSLGGMEVGSVWGHGSYVAPDWTADWLHREASFVLDEWAQAEWGKPYAELTGEDQARLRGRLEEMYRRNTYDAETNSIRIEPVRARAFEACLRHFSQVFRNGEPRYAIPAGSVSSLERMRQFASFIFWTAWSAAATRPGDTMSFTNNWPYEPLIGGQPGRAFYGPASASSCCWPAFAPWCGGSHRKGRKSQKFHRPRTVPWASGRRHHPSSPL